MMILLKRILFENMHVLSTDVQYMPMHAKERKRKFAAVTDTSNLVHLKKQYSRTAAENI